MTDEERVFPSEEWIEKYVQELNANDAYEDAAKTWEGDFIFQIDPDGEVVEKTIRFYLDLWHGKCREGRMAGSDDDAEYVYAGPYGNWKKLIKGEIDPIKGLMSRKFKLSKGDMGKVMRATKAAAELVTTASNIPTKFMDE